MRTGILTPRIYVEAWWVWQLPCNPIAWLARWIARLA